MGKRIDTYPTDTVINDGDKVIGTDISDGSTKNYTIESIKDFTFKDLNSILTTGFIPVKGNTEFTDSSLEELNDLIKSSKEFQITPGGIYIGAKNTNESWKIYVDNTLIRFGRWNTQTLSYESIGSFGGSLITDKILLEDNPISNIQIKDSDGNIRNLISSTIFTKGTKVGDTKGVTYIITDDKIKRANINTNDYEKIFQNISNETLLTDTITIDQGINISIDAVSVKSIIIDNNGTDTLYQVKAYDLNNSNKLVYRNVSDTEFENGLGDVLKNEKTPSPIKNIFTAIGGANIRFIFKFASQITLRGSTTTGSFVPYWGVIEDILNDCEVFSLCNWKEKIWNKDDWIIESGKIYTCKQSGSQIGTFQDNSSKWNILGPGTSTILTGDIDGGTPQSSGEGVLDGGSP